MDWILRRTGSKQFSRQVVGTISVFLSAQFLLVAYFLEVSLPVVGCITASAFFAGMSGPAGYTVSIDLGGKHVGTVFSTMNMAGNLGAALTPIVVERLAAGWGWNLVLLFLSAVYVAAGLCWIFLKVQGSIFKDVESAPALLPPDSRIMPLALEKKSLLPEPGIQEPIR